MPALSDDEHAAVTRGQDPEARTASASQRPEMTTRHKIIAAATLVFFATGVAADVGTELRRCALIDVPETRLACYDKLSRREAERAAATAATPAVAGAVADGTPAPVATPPPATSAPPPVPAAAADDSMPTSDGESDFGLEEQRAEETKLIQSRIAGTFDGWSGKTEFPLENGQVWRQSAGGKLVTKAVESPEVEIRRGFMGVYYLKVEGYNRTVKVQRIK